MKKYNYKKGDKVVIVSNDGFPSHNLTIGETAEVTGCFDASILECVQGKKKQYVSIDDIKPDHFTRDDIKAGYLLEVKDGRDGSTFYMTVAQAKHGGAGCCAPGKHWWPMGFFDRGTLRCCDGDEIIRVYGPTTNKHLLDNTPEDRELLWERQEEPKVVEMTVAEISEKLGYEVKIVKEG